MESNQGNPVYLCRAHNFLIEKNFSLNTSLENILFYLDVYRCSTSINHNLITDSHNLTSDIDHTLISNIGTNTHLQIDSHINDSTIHFLTSQIIHNQLTSGIQGGTTNQYYHLTNAQHTNLTNNSPSFTTSVSTPLVMFNGTSTYLNYNVSSNSLELFVNGTKFAEWGG
jgi:hypothetical protein